MGGEIDVVVTRYREPLLWLEPLLNRAGWHFFVYSTGREPAQTLCAHPSVTCTAIPNAGYEWHGYLRHVLDRYARLADTTIFLQGDPFTVSPDTYCLLNQTEYFAPVQALSWVQQAKKKMELFQQYARPNTRTRAARSFSRAAARSSPAPRGGREPGVVRVRRCKVSHVRGCRVWVEPVTSGLRPMLHGDRWLHRACRMAKRMKVRSTDLPNMASGTCRPF